MTHSLLHTFFPELYSTAHSKYNLVRSGESEFILELNVVGLDERHIDIELSKNRLTISSVGLDESKDYLYKGFQPTSFNHSFLLNDNVVIKDAKVKNGILSITISEKIPENKKPKKIPITH